MLNGRDIICISSIDWDFIWQGHQEIMATLAAHGNRVLFVENTGVRRPSIHDLSRVVKRLRNWRRGVKGFRRERENLAIFSPMVLPFPYARVARWVNRAILTRALTRWMRATGARRPLVWTFLPTPLVRDLIGRIEPELTVYYCIDDFASSSQAARRVAKSEDEVFRLADLVFVTSENLRARAAQLNDAVHVFPFGVDYARFAAVRERADGVAPDLADVPRPIAGYIGGIHRWIDQDLLVETARRRPETTFVLIGPMQTDVSRLAACPNVRLLGARPHTELPAYIKGFDVGLVPYRLSEYTANVYPTKLNEYLAMGIPVVSTDLPEIRRFNAEHRDVVAIAGDAVGFAAAVASAVVEDSPVERARRVETARSNSWEARIGLMSELIEKTLAARRAAGDRWEDRLHRLYQRAFRHLVRTGVAVAALYLLVFHTPLIWAVAAPLRVEERPRSSDAIVVFAGGVGETGRPGGYEERVIHAAELYRQGYAPRMVFLSGYVHTLREAELMRVLAISRGVPSEAIVLEERGLSTHETVSLVGKMLNQGGWRTALVVSSPYHMRRAAWTFRKLAPEVEVVAAPVPESRFYASDHGASLAQIGGIVHEYEAILYYWWKGWL